MPFEIGVEKAGDVLEIPCVLFARWLDSRIAPGLDFADEQALPIARFLHGLDGPRFAWLHPRHGEVVHRHPVTFDIMRHVEPQVLQASPAGSTRSSASSSDRHTSSFLTARGAPPPLALARRRGSAALPSGASLGPQALTFTSFRLWG
jgi:hypothetical protein